MVAAIDATKPAQGVPASKADLRGNLAEIQARIADVEDYRDGAPDDAAGNATMFQAAIDDINAAGGGTLRYSRGYVVGAFTVKSRVLLWGQHYALDFRGQTASNVLNISGDYIGLYQVHATADGGATSVVWAAGALNDLIVDDCEFYAASEDTAPFMLFRLQEQNVHRVTVTRSRFHDGKLGFYFNDTTGAAPHFECEDVLVEGNRFWRLRDEGVGINSPGSPGLGAKRIKILNNSYLNMGSSLEPKTNSFATLASIAGTVDYEISGNTVDGFQGVGIWIEDDSNYGVITNNTFRNQNDGPGTNSNKHTIAAIGNSDFGLIANNQIYDVQPGIGPAIHIDMDVSNTTAGWVIEGNYLRTITGSGLSISANTQPAAIRNNIIVGVTGIGINSHWNCAVEGNIVEGAGAASYNMASSVGWKANRKFRNNAAISANSATSPFNAGGSFLMTAHDLTVHKTLTSAGGMTEILPFFTLRRDGRGDLLISAFTFFGVDTEYALHVPFTFEPVGGFVLGTPYFDGVVAGGTEISAITVTHSNLNIRIQATATDTAIVEVRAELSGYVS